MAGSASWFNSAANKSKSSAHFGVGLDGSIDQYVKTTDTAHANGVMEPGNSWAAHFGADWANDETLQIETEDTLGGGIIGAQPVSDKQYIAVYTLCRWVLTLPECKSIKTLATHRSISPQSRANCPGPRWIATGGFATLARELGLETLV